MGARTGSLTRPDEGAPAPAATNGRRAEKSARNRRALFQAAAAVVGEFGYADASIARITTRAGLAQGTFYLYFASRQDLFDQLLPEIGQELLDFLGRRVRNARDIFEVEERAFRASFEYLSANPGFYRILNEAEVAAPKAFAQHFRNVATRYLAALRRSHAESAVPDYDERELELVVYMIMGARSYVNLWFSKAENRRGRLPEWCVEVYMKFVRGAFAGGEGTKAKRRRPENGRAPAGLRDK